MADRNIKVKITGEDQASQVLAGIEGKLKSFGSALEAIGIAEVVAKMAEFVRSAIDVGESLSHLSEKTGVSVETLSSLSVAAKLAGVGTDGLEKGLKFLAKSMADAGSGGQKSVDAFRALGVAVTDGQGHLREMDQVLGDVADKFQKAKDGPEKAALAIKVFGREGTQMIPMLNQGRAGLAAMTEEAKKLGVYMTGTQAAEMKEFDDNLKRLGEQATGLAMHFAEGLIPEINALVQSMIGPGKTAFDVMEKAGEAVGWVLNHLVLGFYSLLAAVEWFGEKSSVALGAFLSAVTGDFSGALDLIQKFLGITRDAAAEEIEFQLALKNDQLNPSDSDKALQGKLAAAKEAARKRAQANNEALAVGNQNAAKLWKERLAMEMENEKLAADFSKSMNDIKLQQLQLMYDHDLISAAEYYDKKKKLQIDSLNAEINAITQELDAADRANKKAPNESEHIAAMMKINQLTEQLTVATAKLNALQNKTVGGENDPILQKLSDMELAVAEVGKVQQAIDVVNAKLAVGEERIANLVSRGQISEADGIKQINELHKATADELSVLIRKYEEYAQKSGDKRLIQNVEALKQKTIELNQTQSLVRDGLRNGMMQSFDGFFNELIDGSASGKKAFEDLGKSMLKMIAQLIIKLIMMQVILKLVNSLLGAIGLGSAGGNPNLSGAAAEPGFFSTGGGRAGGGPVMAGHAVAINEVGQEMFVPSADGNIVPHSQLAGGAAERPVSVQIVNQSSTPVQGQKGSDQIDVHKIVVGVILRDMQQNGPVVQAQKQMFGK